MMQQHSTLSRQQQHSPTDIADGFAGSGILLRKVNSSSPQGTAAFMSQCNMLRCAFSALPQALLTSLTSSFAGAWRVT